MLPCPPETFIVPLLYTIPWYALIELAPLNVVSSITAIPDERELLSLLPSPSPSYIPVLTLGVALLNA